MLGRWGQLAGGPFGCDACGPGPRPAHWYWQYLNSPQLEGKAGCGHRAGPSGRWDRWRPGLGRSDHPRLGQPANAAAIMIMMGWGGAAAGPPGPPTGRSPGLDAHSGPQGPLKAQDPSYLHRDFEWQHWVSA